MRSIRRWLLLALLALLALVSLLGGALTYSSARAEIGQLLDEEMRQVALSLRDHARLDTDRIARSAERPEQRLLVQVDDPRGGQQYRSREVAPLPPAAGEGFRELDHAGQAWRVYALPYESQLIQVAQPTAQRRVLALRTTLRILTPLLLLIPVAAALLWWIVGRAFRPLDALGMQLAQRQPTSLTPLTPDHLPQEARPLVGALNDLLARLQAAFEQQRSLTADAAHALRTPLAALTLQAQLARRAAEGPARDAALDRLEAGVKRATHLATQLLALARLDPDAARDPVVPLDLARLVQDAAAEMRPLAHGAQLDLAVALPGDAPIKGFEAPLRMAITNLLDNAVRYTPAGGRVSVQLAAEGAGYRLAVSDTGPGLAAEERERVFDRFTRGRDAAAPGSGLGLAIVREVARLHGGRAWIEDGPEGRGLTASLWLPEGDALTAA